MGVMLYRVPSTVYCSIKPLILDGTIPRTIHLGREATLQPSRRGWTESLAEFLAGEDVLIPMVGYGRICYDGSIRQFETRRDEMRRLDTIRYDRTYYELV
ncbi:hypothetical protein CLCR_00967 [Cladophialophora carrionii]|uniref:Uncharacterized protein n=1 Tax=Cladophialophora carrionii TaxID=86049 RepID=A0A1C1D1K4_9EURO|nr:hypothetical protein CLCR_00967 [Cladophialophora carrionii]